MESELGRLLTVMLPYADDVLPRTTERAIALFRDLVDIKCVLAVSNQENYDKWRAAEAEAAKLRDTLIDYGHKAVSQCGSVRPGYLALDELVAQHEERGAEIDELREEVAKLREERDAAQNGLRYWEGIRDENGRLRARVEEVEDARETEEALMIAAEQALDGMTRAKEAWQLLRRKSFERAAEAQRQVSDLETQLQYERKLYAESTLKGAGILEGLGRALEAEREKSGRMERALVKYGAHLDGDCKWNDNPCLCGLDAALALAPAPDADLSVHAEEWREVVEGLLVEPHGCRFCDSGRLRNAAKPHEFACPYDMAADLILRSYGHLPPAPAQEPRRV